MAASVDPPGDGATLIGKSAGGVLALAAAGAGLPVGRVVVFEPPFATPEFPLPAPPDLPERLAALVASGHHGDAVELFLTHAVGLPGEAVTQTRLTEDWAANEALAASTVYDTTLSRRYPGPSDVASVGVPVLVLAGETTWPMLRAAAVALTDALPAGEYLTVAGADHQLDAASVAAAVRDFLAQE